MIRGRIAAVALAIVLGAAGTSVSGVAEAAWPGSNGTIYFVCRGPGVQYAGQDICRINPDGTGLVNLTNTPTQAENIPDVSPNGTKVSFVRTIGADTRVWVMNPDGTGQQQVTSLPSDGASFTPDGNAIAYRAQVGGSYEFQVQPLAGGSPVVLRAANGSDFPPRYAANGSWLYARSAPVSPGSGTETTQVFVVTGAGEQQVTVSDPALTANNFPSWSADGAAVIYQRTSSAQSDLYAVPSGGGTEVRLTNTALPVKESWAQYSPDGTKIVFHQEDATHDFFHPQLMIADADGTDRALLATPTLDYAAFAVWAPSGGAVPPTHTASFNADAPSKVKTGKKLRVTLRCLGDLPCVVTYGATLKVPGKGKPQKFTVKGKAVTMPGLTNQQVTFKVPGKAKAAVAAALKAGKKPTWQVTVVARQSGGTVIRSLTLTATVTS